MIDDEIAFAGRDKTAVVGIGQTAFMRDSGRSVLSLATEAALAARYGLGRELFTAFRSAVGPAETGAAVVV